MKDRKEEQKENTRTSVKIQNIEKKIKKKYIANIYNQCRVTAFEEDEIWKEEEIWKEDVIY